MGDAPVVPADTKKPWLSKTLWINLILAVSAFFPPVQAFISGHQELALVIPGVVNGILRLLTKDAVSLQD